MSIINYSSPMSSLTHNLPPIYSSLDEVLSNDDSDIMERPEDYLESFIHTGISIIIL